MSPDWRHAHPDEWMSHVLRIHFDPENGSPYWLERQRELGFDVLQEVRSTDDLLRFGPMCEADLTARPLADFLPRPLLKRRDEWVVVETGGSTGDPKTTLYTRNELPGIFVDPFREIALANGFPQGVGWLYAGPTGPHVIGRAARGNARSLGSADPFCIDFDPRWAKKLVPGSIGQRRYLDHVVGQCLRVIRQQEIGVLFTTPVVLLALAERLKPDLRLRIEGIFYGGMSITPEDYRSLADEGFPNAVHLSGFGNTLFGLALQQRQSRDGDFDYYYPGVRVLPRLVERSDGGTPSAERLEREVADGEAGQLVLTRLDESFLILNLFERDEAERLAPPDSGERFPLRTPGLRNPRPLAETNRPAVSGFY